MEAKWRRIFSKNVAPTKRDVPSPLQTVRNYQNALTNIGGVVLFQQVASGGGTTSMKLVRGTDEIWVRVNVGDSSNNYSVVVVEKAGTEQTVVANADVYGLYFDTGKAVVKPESEPAIAKIVTLLTQDAKLNALGVGHTDRRVWERRREAYAPRLRAD